MKPDDRVDRGNPDPQGKSHDVADQPLPERPARDGWRVPCSFPKGYLRVDPEILTGKATPEQIEEVTRLVDRIRNGERGIVAPPGVEWVPLVPYSHPRTDRAPHGTGIVLAALLGAAIWSAMLALGWLALSLIGG